MGMKRFNVTVNGTAYDVVVEEAALGAVQTGAPAPQPQAAVQPPQVAAQTNGEVNTAAVTTEALADAEVMEAPMPGTVLDVKVKTGDNVKAGDVLLILEAMKMENEIMAPRDAVIAGVHVAKGDTVDSGNPLISLE